MSNDIDGDDVGLGRIESNAEVDQLQPEITIERRERRFYLVCFCGPILQFEQQIKMLAAKPRVLYLLEQTLETVIEHKYKLLKILDRVVEIKAPLDIIF